MFCEKCGREMGDDDLFCERCGAPAGKLIAENDAPGSSGGTFPGEPKGLDQQSEFNEAAERFRGDGKTGTASKRKQGLKIAVAAIVVAALIAVGVFAFLQYQANEKAHAPVAIKVDTKVPGYTSDDGSGIPLAVEGTDLDGNAVSEGAVVSSRGGEFELKRGTYEMKADGLVADESGCVFETSNGPLSFEVGESGVKVDGNVVDKLSIEFEEVPIETITDDQIQSIRDWMAKYGLDAEIADRVANAVADARNRKLEAIAEEERKRKEEEERKRAEAEAEARRDKITGDFFCLGTNSGPMPEVVSSVTISDNEIVIVGELKEVGGGSLGSKTWTFGLDADTEYGFYAGREGFHEQSKDEVEGDFEVRRFVTLRLVIDNGMAKRIASSA